MGAKYQKGLDKTKEFLKSHNGSLFYGRYSEGERKRR